MTVRWVLYPAVAAVLTVAAALSSWFLAAAAGMAVGGLLGILPMLVPAVWCLSWVMVPAPRLQMLTAGIALGLALAFVPVHSVALQAAYVACGLLMGWTLVTRRQWDVVIGLAAVPLIILTIWVMAQVSPDAVIDEFGQQMKEAARAGIAERLGRDASEANVDLYMQMTDSFIATLRSTWPGLMGIGLLAQCGLILLLVLLAARRLRPDWERRPLVPFRDWSMPFYLVVVLVIGLALIVMRYPPGRVIGINLVLVSGLLLSVQGLAVQVSVLGRVLPPWGRVAFWVLVPVLLFQLVLASSAVLGVVDQWLHLRELARKVPGPPEDP